MKISRCQSCPVTASIDCMRTCLQQHPSGLDRQLVLRRWVKLPPPQVDALRPDEDGRRVHARAGNL